MQVSKLLLIFTFKCHSTRKRDEIVLSLFTLYSSTFYEKQDTKGIKHRLIHISLGDFISYSTIFFIIFDLSYHLVADNLCKAEITPFGPIMLSIIFYVYPFFFFASKSSHLECDKMQLVGMCVVLLYSWRDLCIYYAILCSVLCCKFHKMMHKDKIYWMKIEFRGVDKFLEFFLQWVGFSCNVCWCWFKYVYSYGGKQWPMV